MLLKVTIFSASTLLFVGCADTGADYQDTSEYDTGFYESGSYDSPEHSEHDKQDDLQYLTEGELAYTSDAHATKDAVFQEQDPLSDRVRGEPVDDLNP